MVERADKIEAAEAKNQRLQLWVDGLIKSNVQLKTKVKEAETDLKAAQEEIEQSRAETIQVEEKAKKDKAELEGQLAKSQKMIIGYQAAMSNMLDLGLAYGCCVLAAC